MRSWILVLLSYFFTFPALAQSGPEIDALWEMITAKDVPTLLKHVPPELGKAVSKLPPSEQRGIADEFLPYPHLQHEGVKLTRPESGPVLVVERTVGDETKEEAEIYLDRRLTDGEETLLRFRIEAKNPYDRERNIRVSVGMRFVEDEWRVYEVEDGQAVRLDDANFLPGLLRSRNIGSEASVIGSLRVYNTALVTYSATFPEIGFPDSLTALGGEGGSPDHAGLVDTYLSSPPFEKSGYRFTYRRTGQDEYTITARSVESRSDSTSSFFTDQTGVIRFTTEDRDARSDDEPLQ